MNQLSQTNSSLSEQTAHHLGAGRLSEAESGCRRILGERPDDAGALRMLGIIAFRLGKPDVALRLIEKAVANNPVDAEAQITLGQVLMQIGRSGAAERAFEMALAQQPRNLGAVMNLSSLKRLGGDCEGALALLMSVLDMEGANPEIFNEIGIAHLHAGRHQAAADWLEKAVSAHPESAIFHNHLALALEGRGDTTTALGEYNRALQIDPQYTEARWNRAVALMALGRFEEGLPDWHLRRAHRNFRARRIDLPQWDGKRLESGRLLIHAEQGLGDQILYASLLPLIADRAPRITLEVEPRLVPLFVRSFPNAEVIAASAEPGPAAMSSYVVARHSIVDLARELISAKDLLPVPAYLHPDPKRCDEFRARLRAFGGAPYVGRCWHSGADVNGEAKSVALNHWQKILRQGPATFVNLQYGDTTEDIIEAERLTGARIYTDPDLDRYSDLDGLAALAGALDQVITTSNITPMITGAAGVPTWVMLRKSPFWYWGKSGYEAPFFDSVRCYRQGEAGIWNGVLERVAEDFRQLLRSHGR